MTGIPRSPLLSRRALLKGSALAVGGLALAASYREMGLNASEGRIQEEVVQVVIPNLPPAFDGYRIAFFTDIHLGIWMPDEWVLAGLEMLQQHAPDILVLGGDYILATENPLWPMLGWVRNPRYAGMDVSDSVPSLFADAARMLSSFSAPDGTIAVVGNHERWNSIELFYDAFRQYPSIQVLMNEEVRVSRGEQSLLFYGSDDYLTGLPRPLPEEPELPGRSCRIVVTHNPDYASALLDESDPSFRLALCGHTHGGQVCLPGLPLMAAPVDDTRFMAGLVQVGDRFVYTSRGLGMVGVPFRVDCPPEVTIFELKKA